VTATPDQLAAAFHLTPEVAMALQNAATAIGVDPVLLGNAIAFESGWRTNARNPSSGATGLIQWMPGSRGSAVELGTSTDAILVMSPMQQLDLVRRYFQLPRIRSHGPLKTQLDVYMAIFYPDAIGKGPGYVFPQSVQASNPGIVTAADYYALAQGHQHVAPAVTGLDVTPDVTPPGAGPNVALIALGGLAALGVALALVAVAANAGGGGYAMAGGRRSRRVR
jgi:hypothetical protein